jgi:hypothetical protein
LLESSGAVATWEFPAVVPHDQTSLWPRAAGTPERKKRHLATRVESGRLEARVEGADPGFEWHFATPIEAAVFRAELTADAPGRLQLFWSSRACPTFTESCSASRAVERGESLVEFLLDRSVAIRELRLELPEAKGTRLSFKSLVFSREAHLAGAWMGRETTTVDVEADGLELHTLQPDPWLVAATPGLHASRVGSVEVILRGAEVSPQLYWDGPCGGFAEACSVTLSPADSGSATHHALLSSKEWRGWIQHLRLDPGPGPGGYRIERITLGARTPP